MRGIPGVLPFSVPGSRFPLFSPSSLLCIVNSTTALHQLCSIAHGVDMHQLTKYPEQLLSVTSKIAALYIERFDDPATLGAVNEIESLTAGLSRKI